MEVFLVREEEEVLKARIRSGSVLVFSIGRARFNKSFLFDYRRSDFGLEQTVPAETETI